MEGDLQGSTSIHAAVTKGMVPQATARNVGPFDSVRSGSSMVRIEIDAETAEKIAESDEPIEYS